MTVPRSVADVLADHVRLEVESIDRMYCNLYVPQLQHVNGVVRFFRGHRGMPFASSALMDPISKTFVAGIHRYCRDHGVPMVDFVRGQRKDDLAQEYLARFTGEEGVLFVGRAQEKTRVFRTEKRRNRDTGATYPWIVSSTGVVNHFYVYAVDADFGMFFIKFSSYFPYTAKLCINGNEYAKRVAARAGIGFTALDNGFATCEDPAAVQAICDRLSPAKIDALVRKWLRRLPHPFTAADRAAGYRYDISILQAEFCLTQVLDRPATGRVFFEEVIRDNLDLGRPDKVGLVFGRRIITKGRRKTPGRFRTRVLTAGVTPSLHIDYKNTKVKQYHKLDQALRTETTINDSRDFGIGKRLCNLPALREVGFSANRALLAALVIFRLLPHGFRNRDLRAHLAPLLATPAETMTAGQLSYDLRRLRHHGLTERVPGTHRYTVTDHGLHLALFLTRNHTRVLRPGLSDLLDQAALPTPIQRQLQRFTATADDYARKQRLLART